MLGFSGPPSFPLRPGPLVDKKNSVVIQPGTLFVRQEERNAGQKEGESFPMSRVPAGVDEIKLATSNE